MCFIALVADPIARVAPIASFAALIARSALLVSVLAAAVAGCAHASLSPAQTAHLNQPADAWGSRVYVGMVTPEGASEPAFRYERRVRDNPDGTRVVTHVTWFGDEPVVVQEATQDASGRLLGFDDIHRQRGEVHHYAGGDCVVGPTLFEFVRRHLPELRAGRTVPLDFWDRGSSYGFELTLAGHGLSGDTSARETVEMRATSFVVGLGIAPMHLRIGPNDEVVAYHGRIPPLIDGRAVDAEVTYRYDAPFR